MLCIFAGPTPFLNNKQRLVIPDKPDFDWGGAKPIFRDAGMLQRAIEGELGSCEHDQKVQFRREGKYLFDLYKETHEERYYRRMAQNGFEPKVARYALPYNPLNDPFYDEPLHVRQYGGRFDVRPMPVHLHEALYDKARDYVDMSWFPENWSFGNGVTTNVWVPLKGRLQLVSWCVLTPETAAGMGEDRGAWNVLMRIMAG